MKDYSSMIEQALLGYIPRGEYREQRLLDAAGYSLALPGKRVRPGLTLAFCELCGGDVNAALPFACAVEMVHTFSLIHDDMPCMDNDDYRRGKPSNHKVFGEDMALLAGDALHTLAYEVMLGDGARAVGGDRAAKSAYVLAKKSGILGMGGGQAIDLMSEGKKVDLETMRDMDEKKTAYLQTLAKQFKTQQERQKQLTEEDMEILKELEDAKSAKITVRKTAYPGVRVKVGSASMTLKTKRDYCEYIYENGDVVAKIL